MVGEDIRQDYKIENINDKFTLMFQQNKEEHLDIKNALVNLKTSITKLDTKLDDNLDKMERKFAGKWVEKVLWSTGGIIGTVILIAILSQVVKQ